MRRWSNGWGFPPRLRWRRPSPMPVPNWAPTPQRWCIRSHRFSRCTSWPEALEAILDPLMTGYEFAEPRLTPRETFVASTLVRAVPHWYEAECGPQRHELRFAGGRSHAFYSISSLSP